MTQEVGDADSGAPQPPSTFIDRTARLPRTRWFAAHLAVLLATLLAVEAPRLRSIVGGAAPGYVDFDFAYYPAAQAIQTDPSQLYRGAAYDAASHRLQLNAPAYFVNVPIMAWLFVPFTVLPLETAGTALWLLNVAIALACLLMVQRRIAGERPALRWFVTAAFATSGPLVNALNLGQTTPAILLLLLLAEGALRRGHDATAGVWLGLIGLIKIPPLLLLPYFAVRRRWSVCGSAAAVLFVVVGASLLVYGWPLHATYYDVAIRAHRGTALAAHNCQSIDALLARLSTDAPLWSWQPLVLSRGALLVKWLAVAALAMVCGSTLIANAAPSHPRMLLEAGLVMCLALVALPVSWVHYGTWLLPVAAVVGSHAAMRRAARWTGVLLLVALLLINLPVPPPAIIRRFGADLWFRVAISHQLFGTLLLLGLCARCLRERPDAASP